MVIDPLAALPWVSPPVAAKYDAPRGAMSIAHTYEDGTG
jgi:hypothetical protein